MSLIYVCPHCKEEYHSEIDEAQKYCEYECPLCAATVAFEGNEK